MQRRTGRYIFVAFALTWFGWFFDAMDSMIYGLTIPAMIKEWHITQSTLGLIGTAFLLAYAVGDLVFASFADRYGRKPMLMLSIAVYSVFTGLCGFARSWKGMLVSRSLTGIGTGGELPVGALVIAEETPAKWRGFALGALISAYPIGYLIAAALNIGLSPRYGWRSLYFAGAIPALVLIAFIAVILRETERFKQIQTEARQKNKRHKLDLLEPIRYSVRNYLVGIVIMFAFLFMWWGWATWIPQFLITEKHLGILKGSYFIIYYSIFGLPAYFICGYISEKLGRKEIIGVIHDPGRRPAVDLCQFIIGHRSARCRLYHLILYLWRVCDWHHLPVGVFPDQNAWHGLWRCNVYCTYIGVSLPFPYRVHSHKDIDCCRTADTFSDIPDSSFSHLFICA